MTFLGACGACNIRTPGRVFLQDIFRPTKLTKPQFGTDIAVRRSRSLAGFALPGHLLGTC